MEAEAAERRRAADRESRQSAERLARVRAEAEAARRRDIERVAQRKIVARRTAVERAILLILAVLLISVVVPLKISRNVIRDSMLLPRGDGVWNVDARNYGTYFHVDWIAGSFPLVLTAAALIVLLWRGQADRLLAAIAALVVWAMAFFFIATPEWARLESITARRLQEEIYPMRDFARVCETATLIDLGRGPEIDSMAAFLTDDCTTVSVYDGWRKVASVPIPAGYTPYPYEGFLDLGIDFHLDPFSGGTVETSGVTLLLGENATLVVRANGEPPVVVDGVVSGIEENIGTFAIGSRLIGYNLATDKIAWSLTCSEGELSNPREPGPVEYWLYIDCGQYSENLNIDGSIE